MRKAYGQAADVDSNSALPRVKVQIAHDQRRLRPRWAAVVVAVSLTGALIVVAIAARGPLSHSSAVDASSATAPLMALLLVLASSVALVLWACLVRSLARARRRQDVEPEHVPETPPIHWLWKALAILAPLAVGAALVAAALLGTRTRAIQPRVGSGFALGAQPPATPAAHTVYSLPAWLAWTLLAIAVAAVVAGLIFVTHRRTGQPAAETQDDAARASIEVAIDALQDRDDPRSAVIAAYLGMERTLADRGVARAPAEAPREYLRRVLGASGSTEAEATLLTSLFEEARFSTHPLSENLRSQARAALSALRDRLSPGGAP